MNKKQRTEQILMVLESQRFADWYNTGNFDHYITGEEIPGGFRRVTRDDIINQIEQLFHLKD
jgi:hypothetical protein